MPDPSEVLRSLREAEAAMTPGPWHREPGSHSLRDDEITLGSMFFVNDTDGIVALRNAFPALLDVAEAAAKLHYLVGPDDTRATEHCVCGSFAACPELAALDRLAALGGRDA